MPKFNIGDKVMVVSRFKDSWYGEEHFNRIFTIKEIHKTYCKFEELDEYGGFVLDHIKHAAQVPKSMLQNGMRVKLRNNIMYTHIDGNFASIEDNRLLWGLELSRLKDDLSYRTEYNEFRQYDVMEIYEKPLSFGDYFDYDVKTKPLWKREEETESEKQIKILKEQIQTLTEQAIKLGEQIKLEKL